MAEVIEVKVADGEFLEGVASALEQFGKLAEDDLAAMPQAARDGIETLANAARTMNLRKPRNLAPHGSVIIEWAPPRGEGRPMPGWDTAIYDTATGELLPMVTGARIVHVDPQRPVTVDLTMLADEDGNPSARPHLKDGEIIHATFRFNVSEMRVRQET